MPEKTSSKNVSPVGQNYSPRMKFNSQTTPLTTFSLSLTTYHVAQTHTFRSVAPMSVLTNLQIGTEHKRWGLGAPSKKSHKAYPDNDNLRRFVALPQIASNYRNVMLQIKISNYLFFHLNKISYFCGQ